MPLTDTAIRKAKPTDKPQKLRDGHGLYLLPRPDGARWWRYDYRRPITGKRTTISFGTYREGSFADARERLTEARRQLAANIDPGEQRKAVKAAGEAAAAAANSFEVVALEWFTKQQKEWSTQYADKIIRRLESDIFPWIDDRPVEVITTPELLKHIESALIQKMLGVHRVYNQAQYLEEHRRMMQEWADYLSTLKTSTASKILSFERRTTQRQALGVSK